MKTVPFLITAAGMLTAGAFCGRHLAERQALQVRSAEPKKAETHPANDKTGALNSAASPLSIAPGSQVIARVERLLLTGNSDEIQDEPGFDRLLATQPELLASALRRIPRSWKDDATMRAVICLQAFRSWAAMDAAAALRSAQSISDPTERAAALHGIVKGALSGNPDLARAALQACLSDEESARAAGEQLASELENIRPHFAFCRTLPASPGRNQVLQTILRTANEADPATAAALWSEATDADRPGLMGRGFMPRENPPSEPDDSDGDAADSPAFPGAIAAGRTAVEQCPPRDRPTLLFHYLQGAGAEWAAQEPEQAYAWMERTVPPYHVLEVLHLFGEAAAATHPDLLLKMAASQPSPARTSLLAGALLENCPEDFRPKADAFVASLPVETQRLIRRPAGR